VLHLQLFINIIIILHNEYCLQLAWPPANRGQPVTTGVPNSECEERKKGKPIIGQQATGHMPRGHWFPIQRDRNKGETQG
jgi:hypothetical protein